MRVMVKYLIKHLHNQVKFLIKVNLMFIIHPKGK